MHHQTFKFRGAFCGTVRNLVDFQLKELRKFGVPEKAVRKLAKLIYKKNPEAFK